MTYVLSGWCRRQHEAMVGVSVPKLHNECPLPPQVHTHGLKRKLSKHSKSKLPPHSWSKKRKLPQNISWSTQIHLNYTINSF